MWKTELKQLATRNPTCWEQDNHSWHHFKGNPKWSSFEGSGSGRDWQALSSSILDTHLHRWLSWKCHKKWRMWCLHQAPRQTSIICVSTWWGTVLKLQSRSPSTAECDRNHNFVGREAQESSLPHRLTISPASPHVWWTWHNAKEAHIEHQHPRQTTCVVLQWIPAHTGIRGNEIADQLAKEGREKEHPPSHLSYREVKTLIHDKKKAILHCKTAGYNPNQDALHQLPRHQQTIIFSLRTGHCRLNSHLKGISVKTSAQCPVERRTKHQNITYSPAHCISKQGSRYGPHVCPSKPSSGGLQRICSWHPSMRHFRERGLSQRNHHIERTRRRTGHDWKLILGVTQIGNWYGTWRQSTRQIPRAEGCALKNSVWWEGSWYVLCSRKVSY